MRPRKLHIPIPLILALASAALGRAFEDLERHVEERVLSNGMKFIVLERHEAPVVSFHTYADVGSVNESYGITGISHLLEHLAFKGTKIIGTTDYEAESEILAKLDSIYAELSRERRKGPEADSGRLALLKDAFERALREAKGYVINNDFFDIFMKAGGTGVNAYTGADATHYVCSLPSNKVELWMAVESDRFLNPVFREFYEEKEVVMEERRLRIETRPAGRLYEEFLAVAFKAHPYHHPVIGYMSDIEAITRQDVEDYFEKYYIPSNMVVAIVGDVDAEEVFEMAKTYFGRIPSGPKPEPVRTLEPPQQGERRVTVEAEAQPLLYVGYHCPPTYPHPEDLAFRAIANILGEGRTSRLYKRLVKEARVATAVYAWNGFPGYKFPNLFVIYAIPSKGHTAEDCLKLIDEEIEGMRSEPVSEDELNKFKRNFKKNWLDAMKSNSGMARVLAQAEVLMGDWRLLFRMLEDVDMVTSEDVQLVAEKYLIKKNRTVAELISRK
ncbi:MAG: insulinase family protein [Candidatus Latescibacterota bacterium]|mgnify:CR=1 FL=1|nr:MAG: insulinase family protein [Candidatus Latescibacterota bacterium]